MVELVGNANSNENKIQSFILSVKARICFSKLLRRKGFYKLNNRNGKFPKVGKYVNRLN